MKLSVTYWENFKAVASGLRIYFQVVIDPKPATYNVLCSSDGLFFHIALALGTRDAQDFEENFKAAAIDIT